MNEIPNMPESGGQFIRDMIREECRRICNENFEKIKKEQETNEKEMTVCFC
jgi:hypothetical protein